MRVIFMEFRDAVDGRCQIFIALDHHIFCCIAKADHNVEAFELCAHHEIRIDTGIFHHVKHHRCDGSLAMASTDNDTDFVFTLFVKIFWI